MNQETKISFNNIFQNIKLLSLTIKQCESQLKQIQKKYLVNSKGRGRNSAIAGQEYERLVWNIVNKLKLNGIDFNTQKEEEIAGFSNKNDIECNLTHDKKIGIELKKSGTPDWMQCSIKYNIEEKKWYIPEKGKIPIECKKIFSELIKEVILFDGGVPPFINNKITHEEWVKIKSSTKQWNDMYLDIPSTTIRDLYKNKGCYYIQLSDYGLFHLGEDVCNFNVPEFIVDQQIRIRTKIHSRGKGGFCHLSVMAACQPKDLSNIIKSNFSLDCESNVPINLKK
jgi:hypothetical protein